MELEYLLRVNARKPSDRLHALECDIVHTLTSQNRYSYNPKFFRMFLSAFVIYPQYFSCLREIEATVLEFEKILTFFNKIQKNPRCHFQDNGNFFYFLPAMVFVT